MQYNILSFNSIRQYNLHIFNETCVFSDEDRRSSKVSSSPSSVVSDLKKKKDDFVENEIDLGDDIVEDIPYPKSVNIFSSFILFKTKVRKVG